MRFSTMPDSEIISELCRRIKETRIQLGLSQIELAERAQVGAATIKRVELGESVTLSTLIGILRGLDRLHQLESILFDSHMRTFKAQLNAGTPSRIRIRKKTHQPKEKLPAAAQTNEADATINEWYTSSASNSVVWSFTPSDGEKKANRLQVILKTRKEKTACGSGRRFLGGSGFTHRDFNRQTAPGGFTVLGVHIFARLKHRFDNFIQ